ncbi:ribonuclease III [Aquipuribacter sp. SD81]|uniref:ribonuclease III n=1 Tax=Aquipuribacter sp. SD81 TaxID=3127703 RepID=UPI003018C523
MPSRPASRDAPDGAAREDAGGVGVPGQLSAGQVALREALGVDVSPVGLRRALVHRSWAYENGPAGTNERLEFLGDAVLQLAVTEELYVRHPEADEGLLSRMRIAVVSRPALASVARALGVGEAMLLGRGEEMTGGRDRDSLLADTVEAIIGVVHLEHGRDVARELVLRVMAPLLDTAHDVGVEHDHKTTLQVLAAERGLAPPRYSLEQEGPPHDPRFRAEVRCGDSEEPLGTGEGRSKKVAEQHAAAAAVTLLRAEV